MDWQNSALEAQGRAGLAGRMSDIGCADSRTRALPRRLRTLRFSGCPLRCRWCDCVDCLGEGSGALRSLDEVMEALEALPDSDPEVILSGGEPLLQPAFLFELIRACRERGLKATVVSNLYAPAVEAVKLGRLADRILVPLKVMEAARHLRFTGRPNDAILRNIELLSLEGAPLTLLFEIVPGMNDLPGDFEAAADFAAQLPNPAPIEVLPFRGTGSGSAPLGRPAFPQASPEKLSRAASVFRSYGLAAIIVDPA